MTMLTEDEAKTKWCPLARTIEAIGNGSTRARNRVLNNGGIMAENLLGCRCIASACMAWRTVGALTVDSPNRVPGEGQTIDRSRGYCGAFGKPS